MQFDIAAGLEFVQRELACASWRVHAAPATHDANPRDFHLDNGFYGAVDAERRTRCSAHPAAAVHRAGAGASTLVIADARARNDVEGDHRVFDPFPRPELSDVLARVAELRPVPRPRLRWSSCGGGGRRAVRRHDAHCQDR